MSTVGTPYGGMNLMDIIKKYQESQDKSNAANEARYKQGYGLLQEGRQLASSQLNQAGQDYFNRIGNVNSLLEGIGTTARQRATDTARENQGAAEQSLVGRGLYNTTTLDASRRANARDLEQNQQAIDEATRTARAGALERTTGEHAGFEERRAGMETGLIGNQAGFVERRTDQGPDPGLFAQLLQAAGQGVGAQRGQAGTGVGTAYSFGGINRPVGPYDPFGTRGGGGAGGGGGGGGGGSEGTNATIMYGGSGGGGGGAGSSATSTTNTTNTANRPAPAQVVSSSGSRYIPAGTPVPAGWKMDTTKSSGSIFGNWYIPAGNR